MRSENRFRMFQKNIGRRLAKGVRRKAHRRRNLSLEQLETRNLMAVAAFQQGAANYFGQEDTVLYSRTPDVNSGTEGSISPDQQDANGVRQGLVRFDGIIGSQPGQIPLGAKINSATLKFNVINDSNSAMQMSLYRMQQDWDESTATWNSFGAIGGIQASEGESSDLPPDAILFDPDTSANSLTAGIFDVTKSLEFWAAGASNYGWMIESASTNGWDFTTKEAPLSERPSLVVDWELPGSTEFKVLNTSLFHPEGNSGTSTAKIEVARTGNLASAASINYTAVAGTATAGSDFDAVTTATPLNFAAGQALATIEVTIHGDSQLEGNETVLVTLAGGNITAGRSTATVRIADDDALINEVLANITNVADETNREYVELIGTPGASLDGYYFVVFEGEEEENGGAGSGIADLVVDLSGQTFGANGLLVITGSNWQYQSLKAAATNQMIVPAFDTAGGLLEDSSQTYALIRSPLTPILPDTDYDTVGAFENATNQAIGTGVGIIDQLPAGADLIDSVFVVEGGGGDRDRAATTAELGHPGVHVHQPTGLAGSGGVTSDAVSRRFGQTLANSLGAWFNGDIADGNAAGGPIRYLENSFFISVTAPDGAVLTPGAPNILRTVSFRIADQNREVDEQDGSVTLRIERTGDVSNEQIEVTYRTVDIGSATAESDFTSVEQTVTFLPGESFKDINISILQDSAAEGFERFRVDIVNVSNPNYLITNGKPSIGIGPGEPTVANGEAVVTIVDADVLTKTFQNGVNGYFGTSDAYLDGEFIFDKFGQESVVRVDQVKGEGEQTAATVRPQQGLIRFDEMFGNALNQVPLGSTIFDAFLTLNVTNVASGANINFFRMLQDWEQVNASWTNPQGNSGFSILNGVTPDNIEATSLADAIVVEPGRAGLVQIPLNVDTIQAWANGSLNNFGWSIVSNAGSLWSFNSSEAFLPGTVKPELTILYTEPETVTGKFGFSVDDYIVNENAGAATMTVHRIGGSSGAATVDWSLSPATGSLADITGASAGSILFADGETFKTFSIAINNDNLLERNETLALSLSGAGLEFGRSQAVLTIRDNDFPLATGALLLNEILINSPGNDPPHEFVELIGNAGMGMGSLYYVAIEGLVGDREGTAEKVVELGDFFNGSNGLSLLTPTAADFAFHVPAGTTHIDRLGSIGAENVASQNDSTTYLLLYSPFTSLTSTPFDYDWDNDGSLELPPGVQIVDSVGVRVFGAEDQLYGPSTNEASFNLSDPDVDAISRAQGNTQANRGSAWFGGDLFPAGDDYLLYEPGESFFLPVTGAAMTPGEANTGNAAQSPLIALTGIVANPNGTISVSFSGPISQILSGDSGAASPGGAGISITDANSLPLTTVDVLPTISGIGTNTLMLSFTGSGVSGGKLPAGNYQLNFVGNGIVGNGRAVDVSNTATQINSFSEFEFTVAPSLTGDYDLNGTVEQADYTFWMTHFGATAGIGLQADGNGNGTVDAGDYTLWRDNLGNTLAAGASSAALVAADEEEPVATSAVALELAFVDLATSSSSPSPRSTTRFAARDFAPLDRSLLLAARRHRQIHGPELQEEARRAEHAGVGFGDFDEFFAKLGEKVSARKTLRQSV